MSIGSLVRRCGNGLYKSAFPIYRPLYHAFKSYADRSERDFLARHLSAGCIVVDAGANIGAYSQFLSQCVGESGIVHSFEPDPTNFARLRDSLAKFSNVRVNQLAVSDQTGEAALYVSKSLNVDHRTYPTEGESRKEIAVWSTTLDDYFKAGERVDLIKMDIQGFELHALRGAARVLDDNLDIKLLLEFWPFGLKQAGASAEAFLSFLHDRDFSLFIHGKNGLVGCDCPLSSPSDALSYVNLFAQRAAAKAV